jgi:uncharacterized protein YpmS
MWKLIFLVLIVWLAITIVKRMLANSDTTKPNSTATGNDNSHQHAESMVQCSACQVHLPRSEAFLVEGKFYCSQAHIDHKPD